MKKENRASDPRLRRRNNRTTTVSVNPACLDEENEATRRVGIFPTGLVFVCQHYRKQIQG
jgi:hypothetical protein